MQKLSGIVNGFLAKWLLLPAIVFILLFSLFWAYFEIGKIKKQQLYYAENLGRHVIVYLNDCVGDLEHAKAHIYEQGRSLRLKYMVGTEFSFHTIYLLDKKKRVVKSVTEDFLDQDFSGLVANNKNLSFQLTVPYYSDFADKIVVGLVIPADNGEVLLAELNLSVLEKHIKDVTEFIENGSAFLTDPYGNLIADVDMSLVKKQVNLGSLLIIKKIKKGAAVSGFYNRPTGLMLMSGTNIDPANWKIIVEQDALAISRPIIFSGLFSLLVLFLLVYVLISQFNKRLNRYVIKPISEFAGHIEAFRSDSIKREDLFLMSEKESGSFFELRELQRRFLEMQDTIYMREKDLRQSEEILENSDHIAVFKDADLKYVKVNKAFLDITGYKSQEELKGKTDEELFQDLAGKEDIEKFTENDETALSLPRGECLTIEETLTGKCGEVRTFLTKKFPVYGVKNDILLGTGTLTSEITKLKKAEQEIKESEERYRGLVEDNPVLICRFSSFGIIKFVNKAYCEYFGREYKDLIGSDFFGLLPDYDREKLIDELTTLTPESPTYTSEHHVIDSNGNLRWHRWTNRALFDKTGILEAYQSIGEDITERKKGEEKLAQERERLAVTLRSIGDGVITTDTEGKVVILNKVAENLTGWSQKEALGRDLSEVFHIIHEDTRRLHESPVEKVLSTGDIVELANHTILISRIGEERIIADSGAPIKDSKSRTIGVVLVFRDMTEKRKMQDTIQRTAKIQSLGVLAGGIAHDFNNLLGGIFGYIDLALQFSSQENVVKFLKKSMETIDRARNLTSQLLTFSKGGAPVKKIGPLFPFIQEAAEFALSGSNVICSFDVEEKLKLCNFDKNQMGQVIDNIIINAKQAMAGGGKISITAENIDIKKNQHPALEKGDYVKLSIRDNGPGMSRDMLDRIFDPFFTTKSEGHGIGLTTSYSIIEKHGGFIEVESAKGRGTIFYIYLPSTISKPHEVEKKGVESVHGHEGEGRILVMDDEDVIIQITTEMLKLFGYKAFCTKNGKDALELFIEEESKGRSFSAIICDLTIPGGMGGLEAVKEIRKIDKKIPVFVSSGYSEDPVMHNPAKYGFTASITKPFKRDELSKLLNEYLGN